MRVVADTIAGQRRASRAEVRAEVHAARARCCSRIAANHRAYALRAAWMEPGGAPYLASLRMDQATTWEEFREACAYSRMPAENMIWADRSGTIGWQAAGIQPLRRNWSGLLPVPGDGRYEWDGYPADHRAAARSESGARLHRHREQLPVPERLSAKQDAMHYTWADPYRASRITEVLGSGRLFSVAGDGAAAERRPVAAGARARAAAARPVAAERARGQGARAAARRGTSCSTRTRSRPASTRCGSAACSRTRASASCPPALREHRRNAHQHQAHHRLLHAPDGRFGEQPTKARDALAGAQPRRSASPS